MNYDVVIVGAGAAGLMCAATAGLRGRKAMLIDHNDKVGEKIRISGGGRCNFTNIFAAPENYISNNPHFCKSALKRYTQYDFISMVEEHNIAYHEKTLGQLFCDNSAKQIIKMLLDACEKGGVDIKTSTSVDEVIKTPTGFELVIKSGVKVSCNSLVVATGGLSIPKMGATPWGYGVAKKFGINVIDTNAALVPFEVSGFKALAGVSIKGVEVSCNGVVFKEDMLFTHKGLSGPSILQISSYWNKGDSITINMLPDINLIDELSKQKSENPKQDINTIISKFLPKKLSAYMCEENNWQGKIGELSNKALQEIVMKISGWKITPEGTEGYRTAEVTIGGVDTDEISSKTFEAKKVKGLYFIGEVLDVTGHLGGYNFQWAWSSAHAAANSF